MNKTVKEVIEMGVMTVGMCAAVCIAKKKGAEEALEGLDKCGCTMLDKDGNPVKLNAVKVKWRNPFKKNK